MEFVTSVSIYFNASVTGVWHSVVLYFVPYFMLLESPVILYNNTSMEMMEFGTFIFHCVVCVVNLKVSCVSVIQEIVKYAWSVKTAQLGIAVLEIRHSRKEINVA